MEGQTECKACPAGFFCENSNQTQPEPCELGNYCEEWSGNATLDPTQTACTWTDSSSNDQYECQIPCPAGTYSNILYTKAASECQPCPAGYWCPEGTIDPSDPCDEGYVCVSGADSATPNSTYDPLVDG